MSTLKFVENNTLDDISSLLTDLELGVKILNGRVETYSCKRKERGMSYDRPSAPVKEETPPYPTSAVFASNATEGIFKPSLPTIPGSPANEVKEGVGSSAATWPGLPVPPAAQIASSSSSSFASSSSSSSSSFSSSSVALPASSNPSSARPAKLRSNSLTDYKLDSKRLLLDLISTLNESFPDYDFGRTEASQFQQQDLSTVLRHVDSKLIEIANKEVAGGYFQQKLWGTINEVMNIRACEVFSYISDLDGDPYSDQLWSFNYFFINHDLRQILYFTCVATSKSSSFARQLSGLDSGADSPNGRAGESEESESPYEDQEEDSDDDLVDNYLGQRP